MLSFPSIRQTIAYRHTLADAMCSATLSAPVCLLISDRKVSRLSPVYHGSVCPKPRLSAKTCQSLPTVRLHRPGGIGQQGACHTSAADGRQFTMDTARADLPPWLPLRFSMRMLLTVSSVVQDCIYCMRETFESQYVPNPIAPFRSLIRVTPAVLLQSDTALPKMQWQLLRLMCYCQANRYR